MFWLAKLIFGGSEGGSARRDQMIDDAIEKAVDSSDPRLRALSGYKKKLRNPVACSVDFVLDRVTRFPSSLDVRPEGFGTDPQVRAFFGSVDQMREVFSQSLQVRDLLSRPENAALSHIHAALRMDVDQKRVLTHALRGDHVQSDVLRTAINFGSHFVAFANASEKGLREDLEERVFMVLSQCALERMTSMRVRKSDLQEQRALLEIKLRSLKASGLGMESFARVGQPPSVSDTGDLERKLGDIEAGLAKLTVGTATLKDHLQQLGEVLGQPEDHVSIEQRSVHLTRMGLIPDAGSPTEKADEIRYTEIGFQGSIYAGVLAKYARDDLLPERKIGDALVL